MKAQTPQGRGLVSSRGWLETAWAAAKQEPCEQANEGARGWEGRRNGCSRCSQAGRQHRLPGRAPKGGPAAQLSLDSAVQDPQLNSTARSQTLTHVHQTMHGPCLNTLNVFQCPSERSPYLCCCPPGPSVTRPRTPHLSTCHSHQLQCCAGHTCRSLCLGHSSQLTTSFRLRVGPTFPSKWDPLPVILSLSVPCSLSPQYL